ncbi:siroheme synthase [Cylindrobasidium torrendii FP15055 ss-10]|uniref:precorrin-2 dehydrogenase n=1 Tax=Cylindrobasidium torrendii FP15055 ss-10 TaxID=1314674 RepID=A0A0D7BR03_9AGAR|nr:siroheme synthase [Cylindrobasidium torrendii FP15055 ss-10]
MADMRTQSSSLPASGSENALEITPIVGGTSLLIAWQLKGKQVLLVGGGEVASTRIEPILAADANIVLLSPSAGVCARTRLYLAQYPDRITHHDRVFTGPAELHKMDMVLTALDDTTRSREIVEMCRKNKIPVNAADIPDLCDFYFGAQVRDGPLHILISTNGSGPRLAALIKKKLKNALSGLEGEAIRRVGVLRERLRDRAPGVGGPVSRKRMKWISEVCNQWEIEELIHLDDDAITRLLDQGWEENRVLSPKEVGVLNKPSSSSLPVTLPSSLAVWPMAASFVCGAFAVLALNTLRRQ